MGTLGSKAYYRTLMSKIKAVGVKDRVKVLPIVSEDLKIELMAKAIIYLHPMRYEHFGMAVVEAMVAGLVTERSGFFSLRAFKARVNKILEILMR